MMQCYPPTRRHVRRGSLPPSTPYDRDGFAARASPMRTITNNGGVGPSAPPMSMAVPFRARRNSTSTSSTLSRPSSPSPRKRSVRPPTSAMLQQQSTSAAAARSASPRTGSSSATPAPPIRHVRLPLKLPEPPLTIVSDPWANFEAHLRGHRMLKEASELGDATPDYVLSKLPKTLHDETVDLQGSLRPMVELGGEVPSFVDVLTSKARSVTHLLAIMDATIAFPNSSLEQRKRGLLLPIHGLVYACNLVSMPSLGPSAIYTEPDPELTEEEQEEEAKKSITRLPVVRVLVPSPESFGTLHRWLYTRSPSILFAEILPLRYLSRAWTAANPDTKQAMEIISHLPGATLMGYARLMHETWANAVCVGVVDRKFWGCLDRAWDLVIGAMAVHRARRVEVELAEKTRQVRI